MARRVLSRSEFMDYIMATPTSELSVNEYKPDVVRVLGKGGVVESNSQLGQVPVQSYSGGQGYMSWVMPVVIIVISAMALMTLYAVLNSRK